MFTVWTIAYNKDGSVNNETLEGEFDDIYKAFTLAERVNGEVREHDTLNSMYEDGYNIPKKPISIKEIRSITGLSAQKFGDKYHIPLRTIQNWEEGSRQAPRYVVELLERVVKEDFKNYT